MSNPEIAKTRRRSETQLLKDVEDSPETMQIAKLYWLSQFWQKAVFSPSYSADSNIVEKLFFTPEGHELPSFSAAPSRR